MSAAGRARQPHPSLADDLLTIGNDLVYLDGVVGCIAETVHHGDHLDAAGKAFVILGQQIRASADRILALRASVPTPAVRNGGRR
jgi:hypothetical protein